MLDLKHLQHLLALDEHRHFGRAAAALGISQPALSKSIQRLEKQLGARLVDRSRKSVAPTTIGRQVIHRSRALAGSLNDIRREVELLLGIEKGNLTVGVGPAMAESFVTTAIARLAEKHPKTHIVARVDHWSQLSEWLCRGELDLFVADTTQARHDQRVQVVPMPSERLVWFCRRGHPLAGASRVTRMDLLKFPLVTPKMPEWARRWFAKAAGPGSAFDPNRAFGTVECENYAMLKRMVLVSDCISAALYSTIDSEIKAGSIVALPIKAPALKTMAGIVYLRGRTLSPLAEAFVHEVTDAAISTVAPGS